MAERQVEIRLRGREAANIRVHAETGLSVSCELEGRTFTLDIE